MELKNFMFHFRYISSLSGLEIFIAVALFVIISYA